MGDRARAFLEAWVQENVQIVAADEHEQVKAESLAAACIADGAKQGLTQEDLHDASSDLSHGDLISFMLGAIEAAAMVETDRLGKTDD